MEQRRLSKPPVKIAVLEKDESEVSHCWKICQLFSYILIIISGIATCLSMGNILKGFDHHCPLFGNLSVTVDSETYHLRVDFHESKWGRHATCNFVQFYPVASVVLAGIWGALFLACGRGGKAHKNLPQPWRIVPPAFVVSLVFAILSGVAVFMTFNGFFVFCKNVAGNLQLGTCEELIGMTWDEFPLSFNLYDDMVIAKTGSIVCLVGWCLGFIILVLRVLTQADFELSPLSISSRSSSECDKIDIETHLIGRTSSESSGVSSVKFSEENVMKADDQLVEESLAGPVSI